MAPPDLPSPPPPPRVPKLAVRNRDPQPNASSPGATQDDDITPKLSPQPLPRPRDPPPPTRANSDQTVKSQRSNPETGSAKSSSKAQRKKAGGSLFGFLTLKEPSSSALELYAEQQRRLAAEKGGRATAVGLPGVSTQKLPSNVPRVNSKWDGLPESARAKEASKTPRAAADRTSKASFATLEHRMRARASSSGSSSVATSSSSGSRDPPPSLASMSRLQLTDSRPVSLAPSGSSRESQPQEAISPASLTPSRSCDSGKRLMFGPPPSMASLPEISRDSPLNPRADEQQGRRGGHSQPCSNATPPDLSPVTPLDLAPTAFDGKRFFAASVPSPLQYPDGSRKATVTTPVATEIIIKSSGPDAVAIAASGRRGSRFPSGFLAGEAQELKLPGDESSDDTSSDTSSEMDRRTSIADPTAARRPPSSSAVTDDRQLSRQSTDTILADPRPSIADTSRPPTVALPDHFSIADSLSILDLPIDLSFPTRPLSRDDTGSISDSIAPSEMSAQWHRSPRERLGLGGRIRRADALPWEVANYSQPELVPAPLSPSRSGRQKRKSRLSVFGKK